MRNNNIPDTVDLFPKKQDLPPPNYPWIVEPHKEFNSKKIMNEELIGATI